MNENQSYVHHYRVHCVASDPERCTVVTHHTEYQL